MPTRSGVQAKRNRPAIGAERDLLGQAAVVRRRLIARAQQQGLVDPVQSRRPPGSQQRRERVEVGHGWHDQRATLRRVGIDERKVLKVGGIFQFVENRHPVPELERRRVGVARSAQQE